MASLSNAVQSSRDILYGDSNNDCELPNFAMIMNFTESHAVIPTARLIDVSPTQQTRPAKRTQIINIDVSSKRSKNQNSADVSCDLCNLQSIFAGVNPAKNAPNATY